MAANDGILALSITATSPAQSSEVFDKLGLSTSSPEDSVNSTEALESNPTSDSFWVAHKEIVAIVGGVVGFWGGVFGLGLVYLIFVCIRRLRKGISLVNGRGCHRPPLREDQQPRERKRRAHHYQNFYQGGGGTRSAFGRQHDDSSGGISLTRLGFGSDRSSRPDFGGGGMYQGGSGARLKFGGVSFRGSNVHDPISSQL